MKEQRLHREIAMQLLYQWELQGKLMRKHDTIPEFINAINLESFLGHFLHNFYQKDKTELDMAKVADLAKGTISSIVKIDDILDEVSIKWKLTRMDAIDRAILRIACFELIIKGELAARVIINEAIEIAKRYGGEQSPSFVNAVLDSLNRRVK
jgi:transcription antitermination protein NusB